MNEQKSIYERAAAKLDSERIAATNGKIDIIAQPVADALKEFCKREERFAEAVLQCEKKYKDCVDAVLKGVGSGISDVEAYKRAAQFYFPGCDVHFTMTINLSGAAAPIDAPPAPKRLDISLDDLFD